MSNLNSQSHDYANEDSFRVSILTVSDTRTIDDDESGRVLAELVNRMGWTVSECFIVSDEREMISEMLRALVQRGNSDLILTTGGTGFTRRDVTPEATRDVIEREAPGIAEAMRAKTVDSTKFAILSRAVAGITGEVLIINLPGSPKGAAECFEVVSPVLGHALNLLKK